MRKSKGITLIALVITIIVLLILAGISISMLTGNNGILNKAITSKEEQIKAEMKEQLILAIQDLQLEQRGNATLEDITQNWKNKNLKEYEVRIMESVEGKEITMKKSGVAERFIIDLNLNVTHIKYDGSIMDYCYVTTNFGEGIDIDNKITKVIYNQPYKAKIIEKGDYILDDFSVMMNGEAINVDSFEGTIDIEKVTGDIEITATSKKVTDLINIKEANATYICDSAFSNNYALIKEKLFNGNIDERGMV